MCTARAGRFPALRMTQASEAKPQPEQEQRAARDQMTRRELVVFGFLVFVFLIKVKFI